MAFPDAWAPWVRIATPQLLLPFIVRELVVHKAEGAHEWAQLTVRYHLPSELRHSLSELPPELWWPENRPVRIRYGGWQGRESTFVGYVVSPELLGDASGLSPHIPGQMMDVRYTLLGATKPLQTARTRTWMQCQVPYMAQQIAGENGLVAVASQHPRVFDVRQQAAQSDFAFLQAMSEETGQRLVVDGTRIFLTDPRSVLVPQAPVFRQRSTAGKQDTMTAFRVISGELDPAGSIRAQHVAQGVSAAGVISPAQATAERWDSVSGLDVGAQVRQYDARYPANSYDDATAITEAAAKRGLWWVHATATVDGDVRLRPGCAVNLGGEALTQQYQGRWMVRTAHHRLSIHPASQRLGSYYVDLELGRDQSSELTGGPSVKIPATTDALVNGRWISQKVSG